MSSRKSAAAICVAPVFLVFSSSIAVPPSRGPRNSLLSVSCNTVGPVSGQRRRGVSAALSIRRPGSAARLSAAYRTCNDGRGCCRTALQALSY